jgi:hypothetical protein
MIVRSPKFLLPVGLVLALGALILAAPRTVQAVAAALVQITNTASNPVVTQNIGQQAAQLIHIACYYNGGGFCVVSNPEMSSNQPFTVPANHSLVVTAVDITPGQDFIEPACTLFHLDGLYNQNQSGPGYIQQWSLSNSTSLHLAYPSGIAFPAGAEIVATTSVFGTMGNCGVVRDQFDLYGYLTVS